MTEAGLLFVVPDLLINFIRGRDGGGQARLEDAEWGQESLGAEAGACGYTSFRDRAVPEDAPALPPRLQRNPAHSPRGAAGSVAAHHSEAGMAIKPS